MGATKKPQNNSTTTYSKPKLNKKNLLEKDLEKGKVSEVNIGPFADSKLIKSKIVSKSSIEKKLETVKTGVQKSKSNKLLKSAINSDLVKSTKLIPTKKQCSTIVKPVEKSKAINKMLKSLDIKITGFPNFLSENKIVDCSISENVKTKYRAVKTSAGPSLNSKNSTKRDELTADVEKTSLNNFDDESDTKLESTIRKELNVTIIEPNLDEIISAKEKDYRIPKIIDKLPENCAMGRKINENVLKPIKKLSTSATTKKSKNEKADTKTGKPISSKSNNNPNNSNKECGNPLLKDDTIESTLPLLMKDSSKKAVRKYVKKSSAEKEQAKSQEKDTKSSLKKPKTISKKKKEQSNVKDIPTEFQKQNSEKINLPNSSMIKDKKIVKKTTVKKDKCAKIVNDNKKDNPNILIKTTKSDEQKLLNKETKQKITTEINTKLENVSKVKNDICPTDITQNTVYEKVESTFESSDNSKIHDKDNEVQENMLKDDKVKFNTEEKKKLKEVATAINVEIRTNLTVDKLSDETETPLETDKEKILVEEIKLDAKFQTVRERLQKKYVGAFKIIPETNKLQPDNMPLAQKTTSQIKTSGEPNKFSKKSEMDIYDFKSESEAEETIKMNLLESVCKKKAENNDPDVEEESTLVKETDSIINLVPEDAILITKIKSTAEKSNVVKKKKPEKKALVKNLVPKKKVVKPKSGTESDSENEPSSKKRKKVVFVQKRHRMASLNALAKVQCLYENESRTAHELGLSKTMQIPKIRTIQSGESSEDEKNDKKSVKAIKDLLIEDSDNKKLKETNKDLVEKEDEESEKSEAEEEVITKRELRNVPGFRGTGWHWDFNDCSSYESADESDASYRQEGEVSKSKSKKKKLQKMKVVKVIKSKFSKVTKKSEKNKIKKKKPQLSDEDSESSVIKKEPIEKSKKKKIVYKKRKHKDEYLLTLKGLARKRMAGLNASAIVAATYELEGHLDRNLNSEGSSYDSLDEKKKPKNISPLLKKSKESKKDTRKTSTVLEDPKESKDPKESSRPTSSSVVIVQDTDVTITGVYVNSSTGSSQEAYCKMQYRVQSSVTEERVLRPNSIDPPPKSYTPLGALSSMLPPSTTNDGQQTNQSLSTIQAPISTAINQQQQPQQQQHLQQPIPQSTEHITGNIYGAQGHLHHSHSLQQQQLQHHHHHHSQHPDNTSHIYPPPHPISSSHIGHYGNGMSYDNSQYQYHHLNSGNVGSLPQHLQHHLHHYPQQQSTGRCDSPSAMQYHLQSSQNQGNGYQQSGSIMGPPPPLSASGLGGAQSAFCAPNVQQQHQSHHDLSGYYQPAGPLISPHVISAQPSQTQSQSSSASSGLLVPNSSNIKQISTQVDSDSEQQQQLLQQPPQSTSAAESTDSDVLITGGDLSTFRYPPSIVSSQQQQNANNANSTAGQLSVLATAAAQQQAAVAAAAVAANNAYSRSMHQMHYPPAYAPSYYSPYPGDMCYSPSYQPYFPSTKVYPSTQYHRRYPTAAYYPSGATPSSSDLYDPSVTPSLVPSGQSPQHQPQSQAPANATSQLVPMSSTGPPHQQQPLPLTPQHMDHYPAPPGFYSGYGPSGPPGSRGGVTAQCYSRGIQPPYLEYPPACPCPMQSFPKNVLTGPLIGSSSSNGNNSSSLANHNINQSSNNNIMKNNSSSSTMMNSDIKIMNSSNNNSGNSSLIMNSQHNSIKNTSTITSNSSNNTITSSLNHVHHPHSSINNISSHQQPLKANNVGPVKKSNSNNNLNGHHHHICKMEVLDNMSPPPTTIPTQTALKSELKTEITEINTSEKSYKSNEYEDIIIEPPTPPPSANGGVLIGGGYTVNEKLMEPDMTISPARGSTGLPTEPDQSEKAATVTTTAANMKTITSPTETNFSSFAFSNLQGSVRKPRLGKAMVREYIYNSASIAPPITNPSNAIHLPSAQVFGNPQHSFATHSSPNHIESSVTEDSQLSSTSLIDLSSPNNLGHNVNKIPESTSIIKREQIKKESSEDEDVVVILDDEQHHKIKTEQPDEIYEVFDDRSNQDPLLNDTPPRRIKILELKSTKKSPQNGYKSLIKQTEPRPYLCLSRKREKKDRFGKYIKNSSRGSGVRKRKLVLTEQQKSRLKERKKMLKKIEQEKLEKELNKRKEDNDAAMNLLPNTDEDKLKEIIKSDESSKDDNDIYNEVRNREENLKTPLDITIDLVSRGYFSEPEIRSSIAASPSTKKIKNNRKKNCSNKMKLVKGRSKSETKKSSKTKENSISRKASQTSSNSLVSMRANINSSASEDSLEAFSKGKCSKKTITKKEKVRNKNKSKNSVAEISNEDLANIEPVISTNNNFLEYAPQTDNLKSNKKISKAVQNNFPNNKPTNEANSITDKVVTTGTPVATENLSTSTTPPLMAHPELLLPTKEYFEEIFGRSKPQKRKTNKGRQRFSRTKKRRILSCDAAEMEIIPRKANVIPKWNNGWHWEGEPFQGKVFLNSDDALVFRTCYPAMRHSEGDLIRPRDCVLLRAGGGAKNKELPYVAKVAHLWENPEDGEMMMSLLWYYRPEHTEQGRQPNDCSDEVFASRHRDHNSVACIEDKCYVLTYNEYCRYRRSIRAIEEGIVEKQPIVPILQYFNPRQVPKGTNPEQVMFCQRVYEFRLKRLMKTN